ncbi:MAG: hypothetical protein ACLSUW_06395 [Akkermansia sp.]
MCGKPGSGRECPETLGPPVQSSERYTFTQLAPTPDSLVIPMERAAV